MSPKPTWQNYEQFIRDLHEEIGRLEGLTNLSVQHNVQLAGHATRHQIDVYWAFELTGLRHEVVVQAKDWASPVPQGDVLTFVGVLSDLPSRPTGIMISRSGFQAGAISVATGHGIHLYELREPQDSDFEPGRIREIRIQMNFISPRVSEVRLEVEPEWQRKLTEPFLIDIQNVEQTTLCEENGTIACTLGDAVRRLLPTGPCARHRNTHKFDKPLFLMIGSTRVPIVGVSAEVEATVYVPPPVVISYKDVIERILKSVTGVDASYFIDRDGTVRRLDADSNR